MSDVTTRQTTRQHEGGGPAGDPFDENTGNLRQQAAAYANVARQANADCQKGADAQLEIHRRRNGSGQ